MFRETRKAETKLRKLSKEIRSLPLLYAEKGAKKGYRACSKLLRKLYSLPQSSSQKLKRPGLRQVLKRGEGLTTKGAICTVSASTKPISLIRFVEGQKIIPYSTQKNPKRLRISGVAGKSWNTKSAFSAYGKNNNLHVFLKREGKKKLYKQNLPSAFELLNQKERQQVINKTLEKF